MGSSPVAVTSKFGNILIKLDWSSELEAELAKIIIYVCFNRF